MENELIEERIDRYILGQMSDEEKAIFEKEIEKDEKLKERLHLQQAIPSAIQKAHLKHLFEVADEQIESENTELADNYILGKLDKEQSKDFEKKLNGDACLKETYERQKDVVSAVQKAHLKNIFKDSEKELKTHKLGKVINLFSTYKYVAMAACIAFMLMISPRLFYSSSMIKCGNNILVEGVYERGAEESIINQIADLINSGDYTEAEARLKEIEKEPKPDLSQIESQEEREYQTLLYKEKLDDSKWYKCVIHIKKGHVYRAWFGLKKIAKSDSIHKEEAQKALKEIF